MLPDHWGKFLKVISHKNPCTMLDKHARGVFLRILPIRLEWTYIHTPTGAMQYPLRITLHEGIIKTSFNIDWPKIFNGKNTKNY